MLQKAFDNFRLYIRQEVKKAMYQDKQRPPSAFVMFYSLAGSQALCATNNARFDILRRG